MHIFILVGIILYANIHSYYVGLIKIRISFNGFHYLKPPKHKNRIRSVPKKLPLKLERAIPPAPKVPSCLLRCHDLLLKIVLHSYSLPQK